MLHISCTYWVLARNIHDELLLAAIRLVEGTAEPAGIVGFARLVEGPRDDVVSWVEVEDDGVAFFRVDVLRLDRKTVLAHFNGVDCRVRNRGYGRSEQSIPDVHIDGFEFFPIMEQGWSDWINWTVGLSRS